MEDKSLKDEIREIKELTSKLAEETKKKEKKPKEFKFRKGKLSWSNKKNNYVTIIQLYENKNAKFLKQQIQDQTIMVDGVPRILTADMVFMYKNNPFVILPSWSVKPYSASDSYEDSEKQKLNIKGYKILMDRMKKEAISAKKKIPWIIIIIGLIVLGVVVYYIFMGGKPSA